MIKRYNDVNHDFYFMKRVDQCDSSSEEQWNTIALFAESRKGDIKKFQER